LQRNEILEHLAFLTVFIVLGFISFGFKGLFIGGSVYIVVDRVLAKYKTGKWTGTRRDVK
jgi:hypothetical protein